MDELWKVLMVNDIEENCILDMQDLMRSVEKSRISLELSELSHSIEVFKNEYC